MSAASDAGRIGQALELRKAGVPYLVIADRLGFESADAVREAVGGALVEAVADDERERAAIERLLLAGMLTGLHQKARSGDSRAIEQTLRILERQRVLAEGATEDGAESG